jgi:hypothetical protein
MTVVACRVSERGVARFTRYIDLAAPTRTRTDVVVGSSGRGAPPSNFGPAVLIELKVDHGLA